MSSPPTRAVASGSDRAPDTSGTTVRPVLDVTDLDVCYTSRTGSQVPAVSGFSLTVEPGQTAAIVGESGSGKSTTASAILGLLPPNASVTAGSVKLSRPGGSQELTTLGARAWNAVRGSEIGYVPQDPGRSLNPTKTVAANVAEALRIHTDLAAGARFERVVELLDEVGIDQPRMRAGQHPHELSGGMRQRVLIASAIALHPQLLIADEPTSALDVTVQKRILDLLDDLRASVGMGVVLITHDLAVAGQRADTLTVIRGGVVEESGPTRQVMSSPRSAYTAQLLADAPTLTPAEGGAGVPSTSGPNTQAAERPGSPGRPGSPDRPLVEVRGLTHVYSRTDAGVVGIEDIDLTIDRGTTLGLVGESGSGKSTIGRALSGFLTPQAGTIRVGDLDAARLGRAQRRQFHRNVQLVQQNPATALDPMHSVGTSIAEPLRSFRIGSAAQRRTRVAQMMETVALDSALANRRPRELSGGQLQRVAIARALIIEPALVVFDEAVSALDVTVQAQILELIGRLQADLGLTYVFISHDLAVVAEVADRVTVLSRGQQVETGPTPRVLTAPRDEYTRRLLDAIPSPLTAV